MKPLFMLASLLLALPAGAAEVYRWTDQNGQVHFSQRPPPGESQRMDLPEGDPGGATGDAELMQRRDRERRPARGLRLRTGAKEGPSGA